VWRFLLSERLQCEFSLIRYVPDVVKGEFANIGVVLRVAGQENTATVRFTRDWSRVRCMDPDADVELLESLESEIGQRLVGGVELKVNAKPMLETLEDSLSNSVQLTEMRGTLAESLPAEMEQLLRMYVEPLKVASTRRKDKGRGAIVSTMRTAFEQAGVWRLMRKKIGAAAYTQLGDPLKIDCGYRNGKVRMFHAVSLENDVAQRRCGVGADGGGGEDWVDCGPGAVRVWRERDGARGDSRVDGGGPRAGCGDGEAGVEGVTA
jgi:predicted RNA-binding protein YlxR (DUF448 family)